MKYRYTYFVGNDYLAETVCGDINTIGKPCFGDRYLLES